MRTRLTQWTIVALLLSTAAAGLADKLYLKNGRSHEGEITREGDNYVVKSRLGTIRVPADTVLTLVKSPYDANSPADTTTTSTTTTSATDTTTTTTEPKPPVSPPRPEIPATPGNITMPESMVFQILRDSPAREEDAALTERVRSWRALAHDRERKAGTTWLSPEDFIRHRKAYTDSLRQADSEIRKTALTTSTPRIGTTRREPTAEEKRAHEAALAKLRRTAGMWADPTIRLFLMGVAEYDRQQYKDAESYFRKAMQDAPRVALFRQGRAMALVELERPLEAVEELTTLLNFRPDAREGVRLLTDALAKVPGSEIEDPRFVAGRAKVAEYAGTTTSSYSSSSVQWIGPDRNWSSAPESLPVPTIDRLVFRQGIAVPIGPHVLLVDAKAVLGASRVFLRLPGGQYVTARAQKAYGLSDLAVLQITTHTFTDPVEAPGTERTGYGRSEAKPAFETGEKLNVYAVNFLEEMGSDVRTEPGRVASATVGEEKTSIRLRPGESASPALTHDNKLVGFLAGRTDPVEPMAGPDRLIPLSALARTIASNKNYGTSSSSRGTKAPEPVEVKGARFLVQATFGEKFEE